MKNPKAVILKRELSAYFTSPVAYIVSGDRKSTRLNSSHL